MINSRVLITATIKAAGALPVWAGDVPSGVPLPYAVLTLRTATSANNDLTAPGGARECDWQLDLIGRELRELFDKAERIENALHELELNYQLQHVRVYSLDESSEDEQSGGEIKTKRLTVEFETIN